MLVSIPLDVAVEPLRSGIPGGAVIAILGVVAGVLAIFAAAFIVRYADRRKKNKKDDAGEDRK